MSAGRRRVQIKGKKVLVIGLGISGAGAAGLLVQAGADVAVTDSRPEGELKEFMEKLPPSVRLFLGGHPDEMLENCDLIVISPGVPADIEPLKRARLKGIKVIGELELAYLMSRPLPFYAVTGTNGKSTTTALLNLMLNRGGIKTLLGGNIGNAITGEIGNIAGAGCIVVEVSSFQLEAVSEFRPRGAAVLNITPDHLDRHRSMDEYREAKARIAMNQAEEDFLVLNRDDAETMKLLGKDIKARVFFFSREKEVRGVYSKDGIIYSNIGPSGPYDGAVIKAGEIRIKGVHNLENAMAASAMALLAGCPVDAVRDALVEFEGLEHRLEFVRELDGVRYINDSKGTNVAAVIKSLEGFESPVVLIAGGRDKAGDFSLLRPAAKKIRAAVLIGEAREKIKDAVSDLTECRFSGDMKEAVELSRRLAEKGDVVLLSPACASFDMFHDFKDRGMKFKEAVASL
ncbi:MAG: UDP-N-acetylmuramoyl-L-alanine--D-glutamate ligase [Thermodesulfovibrionales bacterium]|nr:UDP-N-acetylmuramoyl-L-alanine--D-glutamate ligase [Thermodesulfovibrionales bacterium]